MKIFLFRIVPALVSVTWLLIAGCASPSGGGVLTLKQTRLNVDWKMTAYQQAVTAGSVTVGQSQQVAAAQKQYEAAFQQALGKASGNLDTPTPAKLGQLATQLIGLIDSVLSTITRVLGPDIQHSSVAALH